MEKYLNRLLALTGVILLCGCNGTRSYGQSVLKLEKEISMPNIKGRIDHMDINVEDEVVYVAALGNNTLEVVDLKNGKILHTISGLSEPQGVAYIPRHHELFVANGGTGECIFYSTSNWEKITSVKYDDDADDARYDANADLVYVGYGSGGIGIINAATHKQVSNIQLPAHPESFQLDAGAGKLWVNLPGAGEVGLVDLKSEKLAAEWKRILPRANFPMAYDAVQHRIMVGCRIPATLKVLDANTGKELFTSGMVGDVDDFYWDEKTKQLLISGGSGSVNIFKDIGHNKFKEVANIKTRSGARTSLWVPELRLFILAARSAEGHQAGLILYKMAD
ncbi:MAG: YncE family protein [Mucilaginibacter sp.]